MPAHRRIATILTRVSRGLGGRLAEERAVALPVAVTLLTIVSSVGLVAMTQAITSNSQSGHDRNVKRAIAAADAGFDTALYRLNKLRPGPGQCVMVNPDGSLGLGSAAANGWCPEVSEDLGDGARFRYQTSRADDVEVNRQSLLQRKIVATGIVGPVGGKEITRRTFSVVGANTGNPLVGNYAIISTDRNHDLDIKGTVRGDVGTNGSVQIRNSGHVCGDIVYGRGESGPTSGYGGAPCLLYDYQDEAGPYEAEEQFVLGPVEQGNVWTQNNNSQLNSAPAGAWDSSSRTLEMTGGNVTLTGDTYSLCRLSLRNTSRITIGARLPTQPPLRIYIHSPEQCPGVSTTQFNMEQTASIVNLNSDPATLTIFMVGSPNIPTTANFDNAEDSAQVPMVLYAPYTTVSLKNSAKIRGAIAAKRVSVESPSVEVTWDPLVGALTMTDVIPLYRQQSWVECSTKPSDTSPDSGCS